MVVVNKLCAIYIIYAMHLDLVYNPSFRVDLQNQNWVLSHKCSTMFNPGLYFLIGTWNQGIYIGTWNQGTYIGTWN